MLNENIIYLGIIANFIASSSYLFDTIRGKVQPNKVSFLIWSIAPFIASFAQFKQGVGLSALVTFTVGLYPFLIFVGSFFNKKAYWEIGKTDIVCGVMAILGLVLWQVTQVGNVAILFSIMADGFASIPTITKSFHHPETESYYPYLTSSLSGLLDLLTLKGFNFENTAFSLYLFLAMFLVFVLVKFKLGLIIKKRFNFVQK